MHEAHANLMNAYPNGTSIQHHHVVTSSITMHIEHFTLYGNAYPHKNILYSHHVNVLGITLNIRGICCLVNVYSNVTSLQQGRVLASSLTMHMKGFACYATTYLSRVFFAFALKICIKYKINWFWCNSLKKYYTWCDLMIFFAHLFYLLTTC